MKIRIVFAGLIVFILSGCGNQTGNGDVMTEKERSTVTERLEIATEYYRDILSEYPKNGTLPGSWENGSITQGPPQGWTSGFFPGALWYLFEYSKDGYIKEEAEYFTGLLEDQQYNTGTHDLGFMMYCSYGNAYRLTGNEKYRDILIKSAESLSSRYSEKVGCIRSWDFKGWWKQYPVIIDNMMNLELLEWAAKAASSDKFETIAVSHATTTMINQYMDDFSCYHVVDYDSVTGEVIKKGTFQGAFDESAWARGQAWGLYGFTMMYRETGEEEFLEHARNIAAYIIPALENDYIPCWDFALREDKSEERDASAAAIIASALIDLYKLTGNSEYLETGKNIVMSLSSPEYFRQKDEEGAFLLKHSVIFKPVNIGIDVPLNYTDYYYIEALIRLLNINS